MEQQDNTYMENFLQNSQNLMENSQIPSGIGCVDGNIVASDEISGIGANIGGKFEENEHSEGEWKYVQEVQQSEKQQTIKVDGKEGIGNGVGDGMLLGQHEYEVSNGNGNGNGNMHADIDADVDVDVDGSINVNLSDAGVLNKAALLDEEEVEIIKTDGDFSTTSNTTSTAGEDVDASDLLHVDIKIDETQHIVQQQNELLENIATQFGVQASGRGEETEEEEPSSLATNTTNGTSSLSENSPQQLAQQDLFKDEMQQQQDVDTGVAYDDGEFQHKPNPDSLKLDTFASTPTDFNVPSMHSPLNPDAKEFVPRFGSNPGSPTPVDESFNAGEVVYDNTAVGLDEDLCSPHPVAIPRHLIGDDFVAASPIKSDCLNMDYVTLPGENEFEHEAAQRPHELEQADDLIGDGSLQEIMALENLKNAGKNLFVEHASTEDCLDYQQRSPDIFMDHGPETSVDLDNDVDAMKQSVYKQYENETIENILNTVQPLPNEFESLNTSFGNNIVENITAEKESLNASQSSFTNNIDEDIVAEKELFNFSQTPHEIDEIEMNLRNEHISVNNEIPQQPIDMDNAALMQESVYLEHTSTDNQYEQEPANADLFAEDSMNYETANQVFDNKQSNVFFENSNAAEPENFAPIDTAVVAPLQDLQISAEALQADIGMDDTTPSPISTEEKHLLEETKEQYNLLADNVVSGMDELEQKLDNMQFVNDGDLTQLDQVAEFATTINNDIIDLTQESEDNLDESKYEEELYQQQQRELLQNEPIIFDEKQQHNENLLQSMEYEHEQQNEKPQTFENVLSTDLKTEFNPFAAATEFITNAVTEASHVVSSLVENVTASSEEEVKEIEKEPIKEFISETFVEPLAEPVIENAEEPIKETEVTAVAEEIVKAVTPELDGLQEDILGITNNSFEPEQQIDNSTVADTTALLANLEISSPEQIPADTVVIPTEEQISADKVVIPTEEQIPADTVVIPTETAIAQEPVVDNIVADSSIEKTVVAAIAGAAVATSAAAAAVVATNKKSTASTKKPIGGTTSKATTLTKTKPIDNKKPTEVKKSSTATGAKTSTLAATRPRTAPAKPAAGEKKPTPAVAPKTTLTMTKRTVTSASTAPKPAAKTTTTRPASTPASATRTATTAARTTTSRPNAATSTNRRVTSTSTSATPTTSTAKPRQSLSSATTATKPTTLGLNTVAAPKPKLSPRTALSSQLRNSATTAAKSPVKPPTNNGLAGKTTVSSVSASRSKPTTTTTTSTTRTFTARPAPKTTTTITTTTTTTTRRTTTGSAPSTNTTKTASTVLRKSTPLKNLSTTTGKVNSPSKSSPLKPKTKDVNKAATTTPSKPIALKSKKAASDTKTNGEGATTLVIELNGDASSNLENGTHELATNGMSSDAFVDTPKQQLIGETELNSGDI